MMSFSLSNQEHTVGDRKCGECWSGYPKMCRCKGLIHAQFIKESYQSEFHLEFKCDYCGATVAGRFDDQPGKKVPGRPSQRDRVERAKGRRFRRK